MARTQAQDTIDRAYRVLAFIEEYIDAHYMPPSIREIMGGVGLSSTSVTNYYLDILVEQNELIRIPRVSRGLLLVKNLKREDRVSVIAGDNPFDYAVH